tara:strand:+ start:207 stop:434 length:228 start_codon:yes stop_codon:yes gene_type:complete
MSERDYKAEYENYHKKPEQRKRNDKRKQARRNMVKKHGKLAIAGKDIDHKDRNPHNNAYSNLRISSVKSNRSRNG